MTTKIQFIIAASTVFSCTPFVVISAMCEKTNFHKNTAKKIQEQAKLSCAATPKQWKEFSKSTLRGTAFNALFNRACGSSPLVAPLP